MNFTFDGSPSKEVLYNYFSRSVGFNVLCHEKDPRLMKAHIDLLKNVGAKFVGRSAFVWARCGEASDDAHFELVERNAKLIHEADPEIILQAVVFETLYEPFVESIKIPSWTFEAFNLPIEDRTFNVENICFADGRFRSFWGDKISAPDITRLEAKMWIYYRACRYILAGFESLHMGQVEYVTGLNDKGYYNWKDVMDKIRAFAEQNARRHYVICDAHVTGIIVDGISLFDLNKWPLRLKAVKDEPYKAVLEPLYHDSILGRSKSAIHPCGFEADPLPFMLEFDAWDLSNYAGEYRESDYYIWGFDDMSWHYMHSKKEREENLRYVWNYIRKNYPDDGFVELPCRRCSFLPDEKYPTTVWDEPDLEWLNERCYTQSLTYTLDENGRALMKTRNYNAHNPSDNCPWGVGDEDVIKDLFKNHNK